MSGLTAAVREKIIGKILCGEFLPGEKLPAERDFALENSISRITVRRAFAELESAGIIVRKRPSGTYVADTFRAHSRELESIGLVTSLPHEFSGRFVESVSRVCENQDILLALGIPQDEKASTQAEIACRMASRGVKNIIVWGAEKSGNEPIFERLRILGVNMVFFDQTIPGDFADFVGLDNESAVNTLCETAVNDGCEKLIFINFSDLDIDSNFEREKAFEKYISRSGINGKVCRCKRNMTLAEKKEFLQTLSAEGEKYGIIGVNSQVIKRLFPENPCDHALYCVDCLPELSDLNTVCYAQPIADMAACAVEMLKNQCRKGTKWQRSIRRFTGEIVR
jgi:DNA-binding LacI/PurR family transcriptional regulator